jgi:PEP-CTERM motif-containing protein
MSAAHNEARENAMRKELRGVFGVVGLLAAMAFAVPAHAVSVSVTWDLRCTSSCSPDDLTDAQFTALRGNTRTFTATGSDGQTKVLEAAAFRRDTSTGQISTAFLGFYSPGLGVINSGSDNSHTVDNSPSGTGFTDFIVFKFAQDIYDPISARLDQFDVSTGDPDSDADSYVGGTLAGLPGFGSFSGQNYLTLLASFFHEDQNCNNGGADGSCTTDPRDIFFAGTHLGRYLVIAAEDSNGTNDGFKVSHVTGQVAVPEPATMMLFVTAAVTLGMARRRRN